MRSMGPRFVIWKYSSTCGICSEHIHPTRSVTAENLYFALDRLRFVERAKPEIPGSFVDSGPGGNVTVTACREISIRPSVSSMAGRAPPSVITPADEITERAKDKCAQTAE